MGEHTKIRILKVKIREQSVLARIAAWKLHSGKMAITLGSTIYLHNTCRGQFLSNKSWLRHELEHVRQFQKYGLLKFIFMYLLESIRKGYRNNKWEVAARAAENRADQDSEIEFV